MESLALPVSTRRVLAWATLVMGALLALVPLASGARGWLATTDVTAGAAALLASALGLALARRHERALAWLALATALVGATAIVALLALAGPETSDGVEGFLALLILTASARSALGAMRTPSGRGRVGFGRRVPRA